MNDAPAFDRHRRLLRPELMDTEAVGQPELARCLADLERLSRLTLGHRPTLRWLGRVAAALPRGAELSVLDVACGGGDMLRAAWRWGRRRGVRLLLRGVDLNPDAIAVARARTPPEAPIEYAVGDALALDAAPDLVISALFLHHLDDVEAAHFLGWMHRRAKRGWLVNDLHRHALPFWALRLGTPALRLHRFVCHDGPVSVARGWSGAELRALARRAGVPADRTALRWHLPFRWTLEGRTA